MKGGDNSVQNPYRTTHNLCFHQKQRI
uniref:Uncharacterized protein n=1 Tax=Arundo donax TaxID=35708 RepID=A0A0A8ZGT9_ARUDO